MRVETFARQVLCSVRGYGVERESKRLKSSYFNECSEHVALEMKNLCRITMKPLLLTTFLVCIGWVAAPVSDAGIK